jgi:hypothetical protein
MAVADLRMSGSILASPSVKSSFEQFIMIGLLLSHPHDFGDQGRQKAIAPQRAGDRTRQQARAYRLGSSGEGADFEVTKKSEVSPNPREPGSVLDLVKAWPQGAEPESSSP